MAEQQKGLRHLPHRIVLKQLACAYILSSPVLSYYASTVFQFARKNTGMFWSLIAVAMVMDLVILITVDLTGMRPLRRCIRAIIDGTAQRGLIEEAIQSTRRFPMVQALAALLCWGVAGLVVLIPFAVAHAIAAAEIGGMLVFTVSTGVVGMPLLYFIAESECTLFLQLPSVKNANTKSVGTDKNSLSRKVILSLLALLSYPVSILTGLILLSNEGTIDLHGSALGLVLLIVVTLVTSLLVGFMLSRSIARPLKAASVAAARVSEGYLDEILAVMSNDEVGRLSESLNGMIRHLRTIVESLRVHSREVADFSEQIRSSAEELAEDAQSHAATLEETSASVEELAASVDQIAEHAQSQAAAVTQGSKSMTLVNQSVEEVSRNLTAIAGLAGRSVDNAQDGANAVLQVVDGINLVAGSSEKIGGIVAVISEIAAQSNLLSLNAAIEAARAGEYGRGFAVVADEVSKLADRSSLSTKEIAALIKESVKNVTNSVETARGSKVAMEQIRAASQEVKDVIIGLSDSLNQQVHAVKELSSALTGVRQMSQDISAATEEQTTNAKQVSKAVENVNGLTQHAAAVAEELSGATVQLSRMAQSLRGLTEQFKMGGSIE